MTPLKQRVLAFIVLALIPLAVLTFVFVGCEGNGLQSAQTRAEAILDAVEDVCGSSDDDPNNGVRNIMLMLGSHDDGVVTCNDGTNHYFDG